jgi:ABC-2 type transport system permease protein
MGKWLRDAMLMYDRNITLSLRSPIWVLVALFQPICWLTLFAPLLSKLSDVPGFPPGGGLTVFTPGMLMMLGIYSSAFVGFGLIPEIRAGIIERFQVTPVSRSALLLGRSLRDLTVLLVQGALLIGAAALLGLKADIRGVAIALVLVMLLGLLMSSLSYRLAIAIPREDALAQVVQFLTLPLVLLSGVTLPLTLAPEWLQRAAIFNPFAHAVSAARALFLGDLGNREIGIAFALFSLLAPLAAWRAVAAFKKSAA